MPARNQNSQASFQARKVIKVSESLEAAILLVNTRVLQFWVGTSCMGTFLFDSLLSSSSVLCYLVAVPIHEVPTQFCDLAEFFLLSYVK